MNKGVRDYQEVISDYSKRKRGLSALLSDEKMRAEIDERGFVIDESDEIEELLATRDDVLVVCHAPVLKRRAIRERTFEELDTPRLRQVLELAPRIRLAALCRVGVRSFAAITRESGAEIVAPCYRLVTAR